MTNFMAANIITAPQNGLTLWLLIAASLAIGVIVFLGMRAVPAKFRKSIIGGVTFLAGLFYSVEFFWPGSGPTKENPLSHWISPAGDVILVIGAFTLLLGVINLLLIHAKAIRKVQPGWHNSAGFYISAIVMFLAGMVPFIQSEVGGGKANPTLSAIYNILFNGMLAPLGAAMFALVAFYIVSASYRAFRIRSGEATLMMVAAFIVMLGFVPIGIFITSWLPETGFWSHFRIESITQWILTIPNAAAQRAIAFGIAVGALAMSIRIWLSLERGSYFDKQ
ncbi:MAG: hypothetical protein Q7N50_08200 [Armatimonadota bacterium]|nr:hypothetical protein [Armatimonadota bacterium]